MKGLSTALGVLALSAAFVLLAGCGPDPEPPEDERQSTFDPLVETLDRAEAVQQTVDQQAAELRRRVEEAEQGRSN